METIIQNLTDLWPFMVYPWLITIIFTIWKPQRYFNSILLMASCFFTLFFACGFLGENMAAGLFICGLAVLLALLLVPVLLVINGIHVVRREALSPAHLLSLLLGIGIAIGEIATFLYVFGIIDHERYGAMNRFVMFISLTALYFCVLVLNFVVYSVFIQILPHRMKFDYVIIHGCGLADGERMTRLLANRVDKAVEIYERCKEKPVIIPSGGQGSDEKISEAEAMERYLLEKGIPKKAILKEDRSTTTMENLIYSKELIDDRDGGKRTALVSSNYHVYRCLTYAQKVGLHCTGIGAKVAAYYWPSALIREFIAIFVTKRFLVWSIIGYVAAMLPFISSLI